MNNALAIMGALGGLVVFVGGVWAMLRGIFRQVGATEDNTNAVLELTRRMDKIATQTEDNSARIARLEGRWRPR